MFWFSCTFEEGYDQDSQVLKDLVFSFWIMDLEPTGFV